MRTITFYSYKGGVGRTMALANIAHALARLGKRVLVVDLDLEAPGLPFKLCPSIHVQAGYVDYLDEMQGTPQREWDQCSPRVYPSDIETRVESLRAKVIDVSPVLKVLPAGNITDPAYRAKLVSHWLHVFFTFFPDPNAGLTPTASVYGPRSFLDDDLKVFKQIFNDGTDYLLLDIKGGLNNLNAIALYRWADVIVSIFPPGPEGLQGLALVWRAVLKNQLTRPQRFIPVLGRVPENYKEEKAEELHNGAFREHWEDIAGNEPLPDTPFLILHEQRDIEACERIFFNQTDQKTENLRLTHDYIPLLRDILGEAHDGRTAAEGAATLETLKQALGMLDDVEHIDRYFTLDKPLGALMNEDNQRNVSVRTETLHGLISSLLEDDLAARMNTGLPEDSAWTHIDSVLRTTGRKIGSDFAATHEDHREIDERLRDWCEFDSRVGFGNMSHSYDPASRSGTITLINNFLLKENLKRNHEPHLNEFLAGYIEGVVKRLVFSNKNDCDVTIRDPEIFHFAPRKPA